MAQHQPKNIKIDAQAELKKHGQTLTTKIRSVLYSLARLNWLFNKILSVPKENKSKKGTHE